jgi:hypothetical protein
MSELDDLRNRLREAVEKLPTFEPEHDESNNHPYALGNDPIVMVEEEYPQGMGPAEWLRRSDVLAALDNSSSDSLPEKCERTKRKAEKALLSNMRALAPHELPCDCPARGIADLSQHADECPRGVVHGFLVLFEGLTTPLGVPGCGGSGRVDPLDDTLAANNEPEPCPGCLDCQPEDTGDTDSSLGREAK